MRKMDVVYAVVAVTLALVWWRSRVVVPNGSAHAAGKQGCASCYFADVL